MKNFSIILLLIACFLSQETNSQTTGIIFEKLTFKQAKEKALKESKLVFIDVSASWCRPCKFMEKTVFKNDTVANYFNSKFINIQIDLEKGEGHLIDSLYTVSSVPLYLFIDGLGKQQHRTGDQMPVTEFMSAATTANSPDENLAHYQSLYPEHKTDQAFLLKYIGILKKTGFLSSPDAQEARAAYFLKLKPEELIQPANWNIFPGNASSFLLPHFQYLMTHKHTFDSLYSPIDVDDKIQNIVWDTLEHISYQEKFDSVLYTKVKTKVLSSNLPIIKKTVFYIDMNLLFGVDWDTYSKRCIEQVDSLFGDDAGGLHSFAQTFCTKLKDRKSLLKAEEWAKKSVALEPEFVNLGTYALLLYKNGKHALAKQIATRAIESAKDEKLEKEDYKAMTDLLTKINKEVSAKRKIAS